MKLLAPIKDRLDAVNKGYVDDTADEKVGELRESVAKDLNTLREDLTEVEKNTFKEITSPCHIAELEEGIYIVKGSDIGDYTVKVIFTNITEDGQTIDDNYFILKKGLLVVSKNIKGTNEDGNETSVIDFTAQGLISVPNQSYAGHSGLKQTINGTTSILSYSLESIKLTEGFETFEANKWYSDMPKVVLSDIPVVAMISEITNKSSIYDVPSALAVKNFGETIKTELLANIGNKADKTEVETALSGKVDKSDILTEIVSDEVYTDNQFYNANAVNSLVTLFGEDFVTNNKFDRIIQEVANQLQTKVDKSNVLTEIDYNASADNIYNAIVINSITQQINETFATKAYVNKAMLELFDGEDYTDAYAVLSKNPPNMLKYIGNMIGVIEN